MKVWIARHCYAGNPSNDPKIEMNRPLTAEGRAMARAIADAMVDAGEFPSAIFCSNYRRTTETAEIYGKTLGINVAQIDDLAPIRPLHEAFTGLLQAPEKLGRVMLVGHVDNTTPMMRTIRGKDDWDPLVMGEVRRVKISRKDLYWRLRWILKPSDLGLNDYDS